MYILKVRKDDNLSDRICKKCLDRLMEAHAFRLQCQRAHREIIQVVQYGYKKNFEFSPIKAVEDTVMYTHTDVTYLKGIINI